MHFKILLQFGGNDILQVYNTQQVKHRLNTTGMYIASTKVLSGLSAFIAPSFLDVCVYAVPVHGFVVK